MEPHETLKSALVGGYDKESVLQYIERLIEADKAATGKLSCELSRLRALNTNLTDQNQHLHDQYHELAGSMYGLSHNMETILAENKQLTTKVECYESQESEITALRLEMEATANDLIQEAQAQAWSIERKSRQAILETETRVVALLADAEREQERIIHLAVVRREETSAALERELRSLAALARTVGRLGEEAENALSSPAT